MEVEYVFFQSILGFVVAKDDLMFRPSSVQ